MLQDQKLRNTVPSVIVGAMGIIALSIPASAVEPDAPQALMTAQEAIVAAVRRSIDRLPPTRNVGESNDRVALASFYATYDNRPLWVGRKGLTSRAIKIVLELKKANRWGLNSAKLDVPSRSSTRQKRVATLVDLELRMSLAILKYARHARGGRIVPSQLSDYIDRIPPLEDPRVVLKTLIRSNAPARYLRGLHPHHAQFEKLRHAYLRTLAAERSGRLNYRNLSGVSETIRYGNSDQSIPTVPLSKRLLYNLEMWRWMPRDLGRNYIVANIPEYKLRVINNGRIVHEERIVVGKVQNKTPVFSDKMETVVFHPEWNVPDSIKVNEILPGLIGGNGIMERQNLRMSYRGRHINPYSIDWFRTDIRQFRVYQLPGRRNALGVVKFMFPNKHAIYLHDTPTKHLFKREGRAYSHGCMRVRNPLKLAEVLLGNDKGWGRRRINALVKRGPDNNEISLNKTVPVHVTYFTARITESNEIVLFDDVYEHEKRIQLGLDGKAHLIVKRKTDLKEAGRAIVSDIGSSRYRARRNRSWIERVFGN